VNDYCAAVGVEDCRWPRGNCDEGCLGIERAGAFGLDVQVWQIAGVRASRVFQAMLLGRWVIMWPGCIEWRRAVADRVDMNAVIAGRQSFHRSAEHHAAIWHLCQRHITN